MFSFEKLKKIKSRLEKISDLQELKNELELSSLTISGFQTRHIFCYRVMLTPETSFSREAHPLSTACTILHSLKCTD